MLIRYDLDYINDLEAGLDKISRLELQIAKREEFVGTNISLDKLRAQSLLIGILIDHLQHDDNSEPIRNETLLQHLRKLINNNIC